MSTCCTPGDIDDVFNLKQARAKARRFRERGLDGEARDIVAVVRRSGVDGISVLEIGGGIGAIQIVLLREGASRAINVELARSYEPVAAELLAEAGLEGRVERRVADFVAEEAAVPSADAVIMQRVVCCYPDAGALVGAAARHSMRVLVLTFPVDRPVIRAAFAIANLWPRIIRSRFRAFAHPTRTVVAAAESNGLRLVDRRKGLIWQMLVFAREPVVA